MIDRTREMIKLKQDGLTYREIAKMFGVSHQRVAQIIGEQNVSYFKEVTEKQCVFKGIRDYMNNTQTSLTALIKKCGFNYHAETANKYRYWLNGTNEMKMSAINSLLEVTGLTYEEAFRRDNC